MTTHRAAAPAAPATPAVPLSTALILTTPEQIRALAQEDRLAMLRLLRDAPRSVSALATKLGMPANRAHYHLQQLVLSGLVREVGTGARRWNSEERYYAAAAHHFLVDPALGTADPETAAALARAADTIFLDWRRREVAAIDFSQIASRIVNQGIRARRGENVLVMFSPFAMELAEAVVVEAEAAGANVRVRTWSRNYMFRLADRLSAEEMARLPHVPEEIDRDLHAVVFVHSLLPQGSPPSPEQMAKLSHHLDAMSVWKRSLVARGVRHMQLTVPYRAEMTLAPGGPDEGADLYWRSMLADNADLLYRGQRIRTRAAGRRILRLSSPRGTDFTMTVDPSMTQIGDGQISEADVAARSIYDQLPSGHVSFLPAGGGGSGAGTGDGVGGGGGGRPVFVGDYAFVSGVHCRGVRIVVREGRMQELTCERGGDELIKRMGPGINSGPTGEVGYVTIGLNPVAKGMTGKYALDLCAAGHVTLVLGNNELMGGKVASTFTLVLPASGVTASVDDAELVRDGALV